MITDPIAAGASALTAAVGLFVAALAYQGYRRTDSSIMRGLAVGILAIAVVPYVVSYGVAPLFALTDAQTVLVVTLSHTLGLLAIYQTFR